MKREGGTPATSSHARKRRRVDPGHGIPAPLPLSLESHNASFDLGSELRLTGLPETTTDVQLQQTLEKHFSRQEYLECTDYTVVNFHVRIHPHVRLLFCVMTCTYTQTNSD